MLPPNESPASDRVQSTVVSFSVAINVTIAICVDRAMDRLAVAVARRRCDGGLLVVRAVVAAERGAHGDDDAGRSEAVLHPPQQPLDGEPGDRLLVDVDARRGRVHPRAEA